jgi:hypothetical protein
MSLVFKGRWIANECRLAEYLEKGSNFLSRAQAKRIAQGQDQQGPLVTLHELDYCVREFRRKSSGTDVTKVLEAVERMVIELEEEGPRDSGTPVRGTEEATREGPPPYE